MKISLAKAVFLKSFSNGKREISETKLTYYLIGAVFAELYDEDRFTGKEQKYTFKSFEHSGVPYKDIIEDVVISLARPRKFTSWIFKAGKKFSSLKEQMVLDLKTSGYISADSSYKNLNQIKEFTEKQFTPFEQSYYNNFLAVVDCRDTIVGANFIFDSAKHCVRRFQLTIVVCIIGFILFMFLR